jgi:hypothetical protein
VRVSVVVDNHNYERFLRDAIRAVEADPEHHARLARELAEEHFDGERIVRTILERALT